MTEGKSTIDLINRYRGDSRSQLNDARFRAIVDMLFSYMMAENIAPDEIRDAAYLASIKFLHEHPMEICYPYKRDDLEKK